MRARVIGDNGYKIELIRPLREYPLMLGTIVEVEATGEREDTTKIFESQIDEDTQERIFAQFKQAEHSK